MTTMLTPADSPTPTSKTADASTGTALRLDFDPNFSFLDRDRDHAHGRASAIALEWRDVRFSVGQKEILKGVSGQALPGEVIALMGSSGAGKTTLLNVLAGRVRGTRKNKLEGDFTVNGRPMDRNAFRTKLAYVMQDDALTATATAREALEFSARLRLPASTPRETRAELVDAILDALGLTKVQNTMVGSALVRGLSGGERKRVSIGVELVSSPRILFLDEPTSGLDSVSAWKVVRILNAIANAGGRPSCTVVSSIHQPSSEVFAEFSHLILLGAGHVVYQGAGADAARAFADKGLVMPPHSNPSDFFMLCVQVEPLESLPRDDANARAPRRWSTASASVSREAMVADTESDPEAAKAAVQPEAEAQAQAQAPDQAKPGWVVQMAELGKRETRALARDRQAFFGRLGITLFMSTLVAILFRQNADPGFAEYTVGGHYGTLVLILMFTFMTAVQPAILAIPLDKVIALREMATGTYSILPYVFSKLFVEIPVNLFMSFVALLVVYWSVGLRGNFMGLVSVLFLSMLAGVSIAYLIGSIASTPAAALEMLPIVIMPQLFFIGLFISISQLPTWLQWPQYLCSLKYSLSLMTSFEMDESSGACDPATCRAWVAFKDKNAVSAGSVWWSYLALLAIFVAFRVAAAVVLWVKSRA